MTESIESGGRVATRPEPVLSCEEIHFSYGAIEALHGVSLHVGQGEAVCVVGANGAGKTTLARVLGGLARPRTGIVKAFGTPLPKDPKQVVKAHIASVLEGRHLFAIQDVRTNLELGAYTLKKSRHELPEKIDRIFDLFPALKSRQNQLAGSLSGGEQQMVAIGRALMSEPKVMILDEPSTGLSPKLAAEVFAALAKLRNTGLSIVLVEQSATLAFQLATYVYLLQQGNLVVEGPVEDMKGTDLVRQIYLGDTLGTR